MNDAPGCGHNRYWTTHYGDCMACQHSREKARAEAAEAKVKDQSDLIITLGEKLNATKLREEAAESALASLKEGEHRNCVHRHEIEATGRELAEARAEALSAWDGMRRAKNARDEARAEVESWKQITVGQSQTIGALQAEVERFKVENAMQYKNIASLQARLALQAEVVEAAKRARTKNVFGAYILRELGEKELDAALAKLGEKA